MYLSIIIVGRVAFTEEDLTMTNHDDATSTSGSTETRRLRFPDDILDLRCPPKCQHSVSLEYRRIYENNPYNDHQNIISSRIHKNPKGNKNNPHNKSVDGLDLRSPRSEKIGSKLTEDNTR